MKKNILFLTVYFFLQGQSFAQQLLPPAYEVKTDTLYWLTIDSHHYQQLEDETGKLTIDQITAAPLVNNFHDSAATTIVKPVPAYWFRYTLKNVMARTAEISLNSMSDYDDFYIMDSVNKWRHFASGKLRENVTKDGIKKENIIPFPLQPNKVIIIYQRVANKKTGLDNDFEIAIVGTNKAIEGESPGASNNSRENIFSALHLLEAFIIGFLLFTSLFNLFFFGIVREKVYLYFSLFLFFLSINRLYNIAGSYFRSIDSVLVEFIPLLTLAWIFIQYFLIQFIRQFFKIKTFYKRWDFFLNSISIYSSIIICAAFILVLTHSHSLILTELSRYSYSLIFIPLLITLFLFIPQAKQDRFTRLMIIAAFPFIFWYVTTSFTDILSYFFKKNSFITGIQTGMRHYFRPAEVLCMSWFVLFSSRILFLRYSQLQKDNTQQAIDKERLVREKELERTQLIEQQKIQLEKDVAARTAELKQSLEELKLSQSQLIQSEKMASLGELTAGIAHEIQNPLNFVNNFSEVNKELLTEMNDEIEKGNLEEVKAIAKDVIENEEKINHHGKRADAIVKGMLQHSRSSSGVKEPTDINALCDEYLRLSYHGLRAKDKSFNATMKTDFDKSIGNINIIPQDIGRVVLNLLTNAFYVVDEKKKSGVSDYEPTVSISTKKIADKVEIRVTDNGNGIPQKVLDKIFQPFFTTKPTGQGTGLGLSLSYDIVKAHGGDIKVETKEREGTTFIIQLPVV